jgi:hypothetical protein
MYGTPLRYKATTCILIGELVRVSVPTTSHLFGSPRDSALEMKMATESQARICNEVTRDFHSQRSPISCHGASSAVIAPRVPI